MIIRDFDVKNFSDTNNGNSPRITRTSVAEWQSKENQLKVAPNVIIYVIAPHMQFTRVDRMYLKDFLSTQKKLYPDNRVIFALNKFYTPNGECKATPQNFQDVRKQVEEIYGTFYPGTLAPIVEIDALKGDGIAELTQLMCQILPQEKLGNIENFLNTDLKQYAQQERKRGYLKNVIEIASRIALYKVDNELGGEEIITAATKAIASYAGLTFNQKDLNLSDDLVRDAQQIKSENTTDIFSKDFTTKIKELFKSVVKDGWIEWEETKHLVVTNTTGGWNMNVGLISVGESPKTTSEIVEVKEQKKAYKPTIEQESDGFIEVVDQVSNIPVGKTYLKGGYKTIKFLLSLALGIEAFYSDSNRSLEESIELQKGLVEGKLQPQKARIDQLVNSDGLTGENELIKLLEQAFLT